MSSYSTVLRILHTVAVLACRGDANPAAVERFVFRPLSNRQKCRELDETDLQEGLTTSPASSSRHIDLGFAWAIPDVERDHAPSTIAVLSDYAVRVALIDVAK